VVGDLITVGCDRFMEAISAIVDGEQPAIDRRLVDAHARRCERCAAFRTSMLATRHRMTLREVPSVAAPSARANRLTAIADRAAAWQVPRVLLAVVVVEIVVLSLGDLLASGSDDGAVHSARHLAAFSIAYAVLLALVVMRPARARTALPVAAVLALAIVITAAADLVAGRVPLAGETLHIPEIVSVFLIWLLASPDRRLATVRRRPDAADRRRVRSVDRAAS
jgi:predicted anti-sigma-YlaC factor YlaD